ncbi:MAG TPA: hypothetical protein VKC56_01860 [Gallionellaceae bacterium]|nr:hypothetical protein [Gallionellaceae bacterium]
MKSFRLLALTLALLACCFTGPAAARTAHPAEQRLVGIWQDDKDPENIIQFFPDHRVRIYVSRRDGQADKLHWIDGRWQLARGRDLTMTLHMPSNGGMSRVRRFTLLFRKQALVVKSRGKVAGRQHRISEATLKKHLW